MENELITLFEQCCKNNDIPKQKRIDKEFSRPSGDYNPTKVQLDVFNKYLADDVVRPYINHYNGYMITFDSKPDLELFSVYLNYGDNMKRSLLTFGEVKYTKETLSKFKSLFKKPKVISKEREYCIDEGLMELLKNDCDNEVYVRYGNCSNLGRNNTLTTHLGDYYGPSFEHFENDDYMYKENGRIEIYMRMGLLKFGEIEHYIPYNEYTRLVDLYKESIIKADQTILKRRIEETK